MPTTQTIPIDLNTRGANPVAFTHQGDTARAFAFEVYNNGEAFTLTGYTAKIGAILPADKGYTVIAGNSMATGSISGNTITATLPATYTAKAGHGLLTIILTGSGGTLRPINIDLRIQKSADSDEVIAGASDFPAGLEEIAESVIQEYMTAYLPPVAPSSSAAANKAAAAKQTGEALDALRNDLYYLTASTAAAMTNTGAIYKYTGNETGYITNALYYYDGTAWTLVSQKSSGGSSNLLDFEGTWVDGYFIRPDGSIASYSGYSYIQIPVNLFRESSMSGETSGNANQGYACVDSNGSVIEHGRLGSDGKFSATIPAETKTIRISCVTANKSDFQITFDSEGALADTMLVVETLDADYLKEYDEITYTANSALFGVSGRIQAAAGFNLSDYLPVPGGSVVVIAGYGGASYLQNGGYGFADENKNIIYSHKYSADTQIATAPDGAKYVLFTTRGTGLNPKVYYTYNSAANAVSQRAFKNNFIGAEKLASTCICIGDSVTDGRGADKATQSYPVRLAELTGWNVTKAGVEGATAGSWLSTEFSKYTYTDYQICLIEFGLNGGFTDTLDADVNAHSSYQDYANTNTGNYCKLIEMIKAANPNILIAMIHSPNIIQSQNVLYDIAAKYNLPMIDLLAGADRIAQTAIFKVGDGVHLTAAGYYLKAVAIYNALCRIISNNIDKLAPQ